MKTKHTRKYAEDLSNGLIPKDNKEAYIEGYMDAIKHTAAPELLEALIGMVKAFEEYAEQAQYRSGIFMAKEAIKKATE
jgi:DNA-binding phage protein